MESAIFLVVAEAKNFFPENFFLFKTWMHFTAL